MTAPVSRLPRTSLVGGCGIMAGTLPALIAAVLDETGPPGQTAMFGNPIMQLSSAIVLALSFGIMAFGLPNEIGVGGISRTAQGSLFVFGIHQFMLALSALLSADLSRSASATDGYVSLSVEFVGLAAGGVAALSVARARLVNGYARWALVPVVMAMIGRLACAVIPVQSVAALSPHVNTLEVILTTIVGLSFAVQGRYRAIRRSVIDLVQKW